ncbi:MAG: acetolactate decarboxylase [Polyangiaceae bacterium]|nr:acetolactate decarboxylase [Polyangiaceae bacterium]
MSANAPDHRDAPAVQDGLVQYVGAISRVTRQGVLSASIALEDLSKDHLYGVGPVANLRGEITIVDGCPYIAVLDDSNRPSVSQSFAVGAPFLVYANVAQWTAPEALKAVANLNDLERAVEDAAARHGIDLHSAFPFLISGSVLQAKYHIIWRDPDAGPHTPELHAKAKRYFSIADEASDIVGFYSRHHAGVFTHHDSFIHAHLVNHERSKMGHLDEIAWEAGAAALRLPLAPGAAPR